VEPRLTRNVGDLGARTGARGRREQRRGAGIRLHRVRSMSDGGVPQGDQATRASRLELLIVSGFSIQFHVLIAYRHMLYCTRCSPNNL